MNAYELLMQVEQCKNIHTNMCDPQYEIESAFLCSPNTGATCRLMDLNMKEVLNYTT